MKSPSFLRRFHWITRSFLFDVLGIGVLALVLVLLFRVIQPSFGSAVFATGEFHGRMPLPVQVVAPDATEMMVTLDFTLPKFAPSLYSLHADDCLESLQIDRQDITNLLPPCSLPGVPTDVNLGRYLKTGSHTLLVKVRSGGKDFIGFDITPSPIDPFVLMIRFLMVVVVLVLLYLTSQAYRLTLPRPQNRHPLHTHLPSVLWVLRSLRSPIVFAWIVSVVFFSLYACMQPRIISGYYTNAGGDIHLFHGTFTAPHDKEDWYHLFFAVKYGWLRPPTLRVMGDDCVQQLVINGLRIPGLQGESCGYDVGARVQVKNYVHSGINTMGATVHNVGGAGSLHIQVDASDPLVSLILLFGAMSGCVALWLTLRKYRVADHRLVTAMIFLGIVARVFYFFSTPFYVRANDVDGHIEYAHFILEHGHLPGMRDTWESFQPPLYYIVSAAVIGVSRMLHIVGYQEITVIQSMSPVLSVLGFLLAVGILRRLLDPEKRRLEFLLAVGILAVLPGAVYNAGRVNNDVFVQFFMILGLYEIVRCFDPGAKKLRHWILAFVALALGIASKTNALILAPPLVLATPFIFRGTGWKKWFLTVLVGLLIIGCYLGVYAMRNPGKDNVVVTNIVTNSVALNGDLIIPNTTSSFVDFSPLQILLHPFNDAWGDVGRRAFFLEYLYKSAFFGEWGFPDQYLFVARWLVIAGMLCLPIMVYGILGVIRDRSPAGILLFVFGLSTLVLHGVFRYQYPFSPSQDFRYVSSVAISIAAFIGLGITYFPSWLRSSGVVIVSFFIAVATAFLVRLP